MRDDQLRTGRVPTVTPSPSGNHSTDNTQFIGVEFEIEDGGGDIFDFIGGELDENGDIPDDVTAIFLQGQCLALATELAIAFGTNQVAVQSVIIDEDGELFSEIEHAYAVATDGRMWDIQGPLERSKLESVATLEAYSAWSVESNESAKEGEKSVVICTLDESKMFARSMVEQDYEFANSYVDALLDKH